MSDTPSGIYDVVVLGAGPAGLTAGMYAARQGLRTAIIGGEVGGQAAWASEVENYLGWRLVTGPELVANFRDHVSQFEVECFEGQLANAIIPADDGYEIFTREGTSFVTKSVIIATGRSVNRLAVPGEAELVGRGVSYCATCDGAFFKEKAVLIVGPAESAADAALELADLGAKVTVSSIQPLRASESLVKRLEEHPSITLRPGTKVTSIEGEDRVTGVRLKIQATGEEELIAVQGVFIESGSIPVSEYTGGLVEMNDRGEIKVDRSNATNAPGIFAAGDVTDGLGKQIIIAAGEGARAAMAASRYLKRR